MLVLLEHFLSLDYSWDMVCRTAALMMGFTELAQSRTGATGKYKGDKWLNIYKFYFRNDHHRSFRHFIGIKESYRVFQSFWWGSKLSNSKVLNDLFGIWFNSFSHFWEMIGSLTIWLNQNSPYKSISFTYSFSQQLNSFIAYFAMWSFVTENEALCSICWRAC